MDNNRLLVVAGCFSILMLLIASVGSIASETIRIRYAFGFCHWLRRRLFVSYACRPYSYFLVRNSADLSRRIGDVMTFTQLVLLPIGEIITRLVMVVLLVGTVFLVQPWVAVGSIAVLGGFYLLVFLWMRPRTQVIGNGLQRHSSGFSKATAQYLHGAKIVLVHGNSRFFIDKAMDHSAAIGRYQAQIPIFSNGPRYLIEPIAFGGLVAIVIVLALQGRPFSDILPNLSVIALAAYRLLPTLQLLYAQLVSVAANNYTLSQLEEEILQIEGESEPKTETPRASGGKDLSFTREIRMEGITFRYPAGLPPILSNFNLTISKNSSVGIAGPSGSGKSTLVDLLLGLHVAEEGLITVDGVALTAETMASWRKIIGYVSQDIYLIDESLEENIAFGVRNIDRVALREAAQGAQILDFIEGLPQGFDTMVGERGVRLSGGQRQRIGLARALYHRPQILILDEATSALDLATEAAVMETIHRLQGKMTMITIAHRLSTLEKCDSVVRLDGGFH
jgi:ATP-binding cassette subfamily C protein